MTGHPKDKKPTPSGGCPIVLAPVVALLALLFTSPRR
jgi:hypothetical protein